MHDFKKEVACVCIVFSVMLSMAAPAFAWGKTAQRIIAWTAVKSLPADQASMLSEYQTQLLDGATAPDNIVSRYFERDSIVATTHTIAQDMSLLRTVAQEGIDPYVAYRFGILAQVIADLNQPFTVVADSTDKNPAKTAMLREQYERDTEQALETLNFGYRPRRPVYDVEAYFTEARRYIQNSEYFLTQDYQNGAGFSEYGHRSLKLYYDNAVNSVADVWYTILGDTRLSPFIPPRSVAIERFRIEGVKTTRDLNLTLITQPDFRSGEITTDFVERVLNGGRSGQGGVPSDAP